MEGCNGAGRTDGGSHVAFEGLGYTVAAPARSVRDRLRPLLPAALRGSASGVPVVAEGRRVLGGASGEVRAGTVTAVLGGSGSGKTTLLSILAARLAGFEGSLLVDGRPLRTARARTAYARAVAFVPQEEAFVGLLTVRETLAFRAAMALPRLHPAQRAARVEALLADLDLTACGGRRVAAVSGGERRRLSIACQLVKAPRVLLADEPTTGLDSLNAFYVLQLLRRVAEGRGTAVAAAVHQPSREIFELFDQVLLLSSGRMVYCGPRAEFVPRFEAAGYPCPKHANPADFYVDVTAVDSRTPAAAAASSRRLGRIIGAVRAAAAAAAESEGAQCGAGARPRMGPALRALLPGSTNDEGEANGGGGEAEGPAPRADRGAPLSRSASRAPFLGAPSDPSGPDGKDEGSERGRVSYGGALRLLVGRHWAVTRREVPNSVMRIGQFAAFASISWAYIISLGYSQASVTTRAGLIYRVLTNGALTAMSTAVACFPPARDVFFAERRERLYPPSAFIVQYTLSEFPVILGGATAIWGVLYWATGMKAEAHAAAVFFLALLASCSWGESVALLVMSGVRSGVLAGGIASLLVILFSTTSFAVFGARTAGEAAAASAPFYRALNRAAPLQWFFKPLVENEFRGLRFEAMLANEFEGQTYPCPAGLPCPYPDGAAVLARMSFAGASVGGPAACLAVLALAFRVVGYFAMRLSFAAESGRPLRIPRLRRWAPSP
eukprot:tig00021234_g19379.t1